MAWGVFNKITQGIKKSADFIGNTVLPTARKIVDVVKPMLGETKYGKYINKADNIITHGEKFKTGIKGLNPQNKNSVYRADNLLKPSFEDSEEDYE